ncbi:MAG: hypothetical protein R3F13_07760 [Prosthecobacter sp.]
MTHTKPTDVRVTAAEVFFIPVTMRVPLKFGPETVTGGVCLRVRVTVEDRSGRTAQGWGETPLSVSWVWPSSLSVTERATRMQYFSTLLAKRLVDAGLSGHPMEIGQDFIQGALALTLKEANELAGGDEMPYLGSLVAFSAFDIAIHDAYGVLHDRDIYTTYNAEFMNRRLPPNSSRPNMKAASVSRDATHRDYLRHGRTQAASRLASCRRCGRPRNRRPHRQRAQGRASDSAGRLDQT